MRTLLIILICIIVGCGDGDGNRSTFTVSETGGDVTINSEPPVNEEQQDTAKDVCFACLGNPNDGLTDQECLAESGVHFSEC